MKYINKYNSYIRESDESNSNSEKDKKVRSGRVVTQAQEEYGKEEVKKGIEELPSDAVVPAMVFTDVVGSSDLWSKDSVKMMKQLEDHHNLVVKLSENYNAWIVKTIGDAFMVYFEPSNDSLIRALKFSRDLIKEEDKYDLRIGVCEGNMEQKTYRIQKVDLKDFFGNTVNVASRMESIIAGKGGHIGFSSLKEIKKDKLDFIEKNIGKTTKIENNIDLRGAKVNKIFRIEVK